MIKYISAILVLILLAFLQWEAFTHFPIVDVQQVSQLSTTAVSGDWFSLANGSHNAFVNWRWDPLLAQSAAFLCTQFSVASEDMPLLYNLLCLLIGTLSLSFLYLKISPNRFAAAALLSLVWLFCVVGLWGGDTVLLGSFAWLPLFTLFTILSLKLDLKSLPYCILALFFSYRLMVTANQLSILFVVVGVMVAFFFTKESLSRKRVCYVALLLLPTVVCLCKAPVPLNPDYPANVVTHVVADDGLPGMIRPLVGPEAPVVPTIDRPFLKEVYYKPAMLLLLLILVLGVPSAWKLKNKGLFGWSLLLSLLLILDIACSEDISHIMPIATLNRTIPHFFFFTLTPIVFALTIFIFLLHLSFARAEFYALFVAILFMPSGATPLLQSPIAGRAKEEFRELLKRDPTKVVYEKYLTSPSLHLLNSFGLWSLELKDSRRGRFIDVVVLDPQIRFYDSKYSSEEEFSPLRDRNWRTRWSTTQNGNEWLLLRFSEPRTLKAIEPTPGRFFYTDFPRGIRVRVAQHCSEETPREAKFKTIVEMPEWQGELLFTKEGYPFFGSHSRLKINLKSAVTAQCWLLERIGKTTPNFDWSIATIKAREVAFGETL